MNEFNQVVIEVCELYDFNRDELIRDILVDGLKATLDCLKWIDPKTGLVDLVERADAL